METAEVTATIIVIVIIFLTLGVFILVIFLFYKNRQRLHENEVLQAQLEIQEQTFKNISLEIHDNIGQALSLAKLNLNTMQVQDIELQEKITNSKQLVSKAINDLRSLSHSLDTDYVKSMGLQRAIEYELEMIRNTGTIRAILEIEGETIRLDKKKELILFRIVQETLNNIIKHSEAKEIRVRLAYTVNSLMLLIEDDGKGVDLAPLRENNNNFGVGIRNMHNRATLIGAEFNMESTLEKGTTVKIYLPLENLPDEIKG